MIDLDIIRSAMRAGFPHVRFRLIKRGSKSYAKVMNLKEWDEGEKIRDFLNFYGLNISHCTSGSPSERTFRLKKML